MSQSSGAGGLKRNFNGTHRIAAATRVFLTVFGNRTVVILPVEGAAASMSVMSLSRAITAIASAWWNSLFDVVGRAMKLLQYLASPWTDQDRKKSSHGDNLNALDGVRGLAVLIVVAAHTGAFGMAAQGGLGVMMFFALSGFVLAFPFSENPGRILRFKELARFVANRALRIYPAYLIAVLYLAWFLGPQNGIDGDWIFQNLTFSASWNHLWSVAEEVRFYALFPIVIAILALLPGRTLRIAVLVAMIYAAWIFRGVQPLDLMYGNSVDFFFYWFLTGILAAFLYGVLLPFANRWTVRLLGSAALAVLVLIYLSGDDIVAQFWRPIFPGLPGEASFNAWHYPAQWCALIGLFLVGATVCRDSKASRLMQSWLLRHFGLLSYSIYLFHVPVLLLIEHMGFKGNGLFIAVMGGVYPVAILSYVLIEKPFLMLKPRGAKSPAAPLRSPVPSSARAQA
jgi:peptidoglycan/LPS O-acetylase OafA/YrhL